ncbi:MAG: hypothetical protein AAFP13_06085 [Pseudomonadota bacterium]
MIAARIKAAVIEGALAAAVACPIYFLSDRAGLGTGLTLALWFAGAFALAPLTLALRMLTQKHPAPEHRRAGLMLTGDGCHLCRWLRFWWPLALAPAGAAGFFHTGSFGLAALGLAVAVYHLASGLSDLGEEREPHWARATGFSFTRV